MGQLWPREAAPAAVPVPPSVEHVEHVEHTVEHVEDCARVYNLLQDTWHNCVVVDCRPRGPHQPGGSIDGSFSWVEFEGAARNDLDEPSRALLAAEAAAGILAAALGHLNGPLSFTLVVCGEPARPAWTNI